MLKIQKCFTKNLETYLERVENIFEENLGFINVKPFNEIVEDNLSSTDEIDLSVEYLGLIGAAGKSTVYFSRDPSNNFYPNLYLQEILSHELGHILHYRLCGIDENFRGINYGFESLSDLVVEGFANYVSNTVSRSFGFSEINLVNWEFNDLFSDLELSNPTLMKKLIVDRYM